MGRLGEGQGIVTTGTPEDRRFFEDYNTTLTGSEAGKEHLRWLEEVLRNSSADWLVVLGHRPVFTCADRPRFPAEQRFSELMHSLFTKYHVDVYMHGHDHVGQHLKKDGVVYIGNGVGGYGNHPAHPNEDTVWFNGDYNGFILHRVTPMELDFTFMAANGSVLHEVRLFQNSASKEKRCSKRS